MFPIMKRELRFWAIFPDNGIEILTVYRGLRS
jgi:hypothetical protein